MAKVITFSRVFPSYHPRKGEPTHFVEKLWNSIQNQAKVHFINYYSLIDFNKGKEKEAELFWFSNTDDYSGLGDKKHTIRSGNHWKVGDKFSPRVWSGKPYASRMITIAPDIEIKKIWGFEIKGNSIYIDGRSISPDSLESVAENDGLSRHELQQWFRYPKPFKGQIICWNESINY